MSNMSFVLPSGSLNARLKMYLNKAGYDVGSPDRNTGSCGTSNGVDFFERDRRMIADLVRNHRFDAGITGKDLIWDADCQDLLVIADLCFSRATDQPTRWVLAYNPENFPLIDQGSKSSANIARIGCELPGLATKLGSTQEMVQSGFLYKEFVKLEGNEEMAIADGLCEAVLVVTETGNSLRDHGLVIAKGCERLFVSVPQIISRNHLCDDDKQAKLQELRFALSAVIGAATHVMLKADVPATIDVSALHLPADVAPTVMNLSVPDWKAIEICIPRSAIGSIGLKLEKAGARGIVVQDVIAYAAGK